MGNRGIKTAFLHLMLTVPQDDFCGHFSAGQYKGKFDFCEGTMHLFLTIAAITRST